MSRLAGGAGFNAVGIGIEIAVGPPVGEQVVGGMETASIGEVGGGNLRHAHVADLHEFRIFQCRYRNEVQVPRGGIVLRVVQTVGIGKVGILAAKLLGFGVHGIHKSVHTAADRLGQHIAGLVGGNHQHALEETLHRHGLAHLNAGGAAVGGKAVQRGGGGGELLVQRQLSLIHRLQRQQRGHDLRQAGGIQLIMLVLSIENGAGVLVHQ
ncbi:hypothetical protein SDC9_149636 [bioreactor metagenome]|uniref:Uncharacterized protein n=1 Tax=bioreactor metagenome TaxID=1076179 RepID=A0A645EM36_9ZZZZ